MRKWGDLVKSGGYCSINEDFFRIENLLLLVFRRESSIIKPFQADMRIST
jgi:hypothetical protein